jgi:hypothetical protein
MASSSSSPRFPNSLNGGEHQDPDDVRVGETHHIEREGHDRHVDHADEGDAHPDGRPREADPSRADQSRPERRESERGER